MFTCKRFCQRDGVAVSNGCHGDEFRNVTLKKECNTKKRDNKCKKIYLFVYIRLFTY